MRCAGELRRHRRSTGDRTKKRRHQRHRRSGPHRVPRGQPPRTRGARPISPGPREGNASPIVLERLAKLCPRHAADRARATRPRPRPSTHKVSWTGTETRGTTRADAGVLVTVPEAASVLGLGLVVALDRGVLRCGGVNERDGESSDYSHPPIRTRKCRFVRRASAERTHFSLGQRPKSKDPRLRVHEARARPSPPRPLRPLRVRVYAQQQPRPYRGHLE
jgi:hypothetical protein